MAKDELKINGAVAVAGYTKPFVAGDEDALADAIANDTEKNIDVEHLTRSGAIEGFGGKADVPDGTVNRQRNADGERADKKGVEAADAAAEEGSAPAKVSAKGSGTGKAAKAKRAKTGKGS